MTASPGGYLRRESVCFSPEPVLCSVAGSVASKVIAKARIGQYGAVSIDNNGSMGVFPVKDSRPRHPIDLGPIFITTDRSVQALDSPVWVGILTAKKDLAALQFLAPGEQVALPDKRALVGAVCDPHDEYLVPYRGPGCVGDVKFCLDGKTFHGWYPLDGHCCCGKRYTTLSSLMRHLVRYFQWRSQEISITPRKYRSDGVLHSFEPLDDTPIFAVGDRLGPGSQISSPPNIWVGDSGRICQSRSSSRGPESQPGCQLAIVSDVTLKPRVVQVWNPSNRTIATCGKRQDKLNVKLATLFRRISRSCRVCGAIPGQACFSRACRGRHHSLKS